MHSGKCDCGCGQHSLWTILREVNGKKLWFLTSAHLRKWEEAERG
jgi:hypothetical protein